MAEWDKSQQRGETRDPHNPPNAVVEPELSKTAVFVVPGLWYYLAPVAIIVLVIIMTMVFWNSREEINERAVPTTGIEQDAPGHQETPGGGNPDPQPNSVEGEREYRGGDGR